MTKTGKCITCRERKVKCDEKFPGCGPCTRGQHTCQYPANKIRKLHVALLEPGGALVKYPADTWSSSAPRVDTAGDGSVTLHARSARVANDGRGFFSTLRLYRSPGSDCESEPKISQSLYSPEDSLRDHLMDLMGARSFRWDASFLWGKWLLLVGPRLHSSEVLYNATRCFLAGCVAQRYRTDRNVEIARKRYGHALISLQRTLTCKENDLALSSETIAATKLLSSFESMLDFKSGLWVSHSRGLSRLLTSRGPGTGDDDMLRSLYYSVLTHELSEAISNGTDSAFDSPAWLHLAPPDHSLEDRTFAVTYKAMMQVEVRIPRLIRLVREVEDNPANPDTASEASALASKLYETDVRKVILDLVTNSTKRVPTLDPGLQKYYPVSIYFDTMCTFEALMRYCFCRIIVLGLCRTLEKHGLFASKHGNFTLDEEDDESAGLVAMSTQYAEQLLEPVPMGPLISMLPLQVAFGSWRRLGRDANKKSEYGKGCNGSEDWSKTHFMMQWCRAKSDQMVDIWAGEHVADEGLDWQADVLEGLARSLGACKNRRIFPL